MHESVVEKSIKASLFLRSISFHSSYKQLFTVYDELWFLAPNLSYPNSNLTETGTFNYTFLAEYQAMIESKSNSKKEKL